MVYTDIRYILHVLFALQVVEVSIYISHTSTLLLVVHSFLLLIINYIKFIQSKIFCVKHPTSHHKREILSCILVIIGSKECFNASIYTMLVSSSFHGPAPPRRVKLRSKENRQEPKQRVLREMSEIKAHVC